MLRFKRDDFPYPIRGARLGFLYGGQADRTDQTDRMDQADLTDCADRTDPVDRRPLYRPAIGIVPFAPVAGLASRWGARHFTSSACG